MSELLYIKWRNKTVTRQESAWSSFSTSPTSSSPPPLGMPFCVGHSQLGAAYQCLNSAALKHQQQHQQQPATRTTIQQREEEEETCNSEKQQKVNLNILRRHFMIISHDTQARVLEPPPIAHRASHLPLGPSWLRSFLHIAGRRVALLATCCQRLQASNLAPFPHFPFLISLGPRSLFGIF